MATSAFTAGETAEMINFVASNFKKMEDVIGRMRREKIVGPSFVLEGAEEKWTEARLKDFIERICREKKMELPEEACRFLLRASVLPVLESFLRGECEEQDFYQICLLLAKGSEELFRECVDVVGEKCSSLAKFMAEKKFLPYVVVEPHPFVPSCASPFNENLHRLGEIENTFVTDPADFVEFRHHIVLARRVAVAIHMTPSSVARRVDLMTFRCRHRVFHIMPASCLPLMPRLADVLKTKTATATFFIFRLKNVMEYFKQVFDWTPKKFVDIAKLAESNGLSPTLDTMVTKTVGGTYCRRGSNFADASVPSPVALKHRAILASLLYEFGAKYESSQSRQEVRGAPSSSSSSSFRERSSNRGSRYRDENVSRRD